MRTSGALSNHFLKSGSEPYTLAVSKVRMPLAKANRKMRSRLWTRTAPWLSIVMSTPVFPSGLRGTVTTFAGASCAFRPGARLRAEAVARAPAWRNVRRSVLFGSSWAITFDSSWGRSGNTTFRGARRDASRPAPG